LNAHVSQGGWPVLVLNADFRPLSYYPLSLWSWQDAIKAVFLDRVNIVEHYDRAVHSPSFEIQLPSVVSLKSFVRPTTHPAFTRFNVFLRDRFVCQYCGLDGSLSFSAWLSLSEDHLLPKGHPRRNEPAFRVTACQFCNVSDNHYFAHASKRGLAFDNLSPEQLVAQRKPFVEAVRAKYHEFWQAKVASSGLQSRK